MPYRLPLDQRNLKKYTVVHRKQCKMLVASEMNCYRWSNRISTKYKFCKLEKYQTHLTLEIGVEIISFSKVVLVLFCVEHRNEIAAE